MPDVPHRPPSLLRAAWVAPIDGPVLRDGALLVAGGRIVAVGNEKGVAREHAGASVEDYGDAVILPGLVNAHTHLELSGMRPAPQPGRFIDWLFAVASTPVVSAQRAANTGARESIAFGVTAVGDISRNVGEARGGLYGSPARTTSFGEVVGMAGRKGRVGPMLAAALDTTLVGLRITPGVSPHAPYSIDADGYRQCLAAASRRGLPITTHLAESPDEALFLSDHAGPFRELWEKIGAWDDTALRFEGGPIRFAKSLGLLDYPIASLAHVNYCDDDELALLADARASTIYCPRTHAYFGHPPHRWREMLARGINVAVGTDSRASSPDLNLVDDLRLMHRIAPEVPAPTLWEMATIRGAKALGMERGWGSLAVGKDADCVVFPATTHDPLREILERQVLPLAVWADGLEVVKAAR
jgi:cytosine/adenosine deaminase-related metal-dependent hydrolase